MVNINISDNGVLIGASPPSAIAGSKLATLAKRALTCCLAQYISVPCSKSSVMDVMAYFVVERKMV